MARLISLLSLLACRSEPVSEGIVPLSAVDRLSRASVLMVGVRPSVDQLLTANNTGAFEDQVDLWLQDPRFGSAVRELHDEAWQLDTDFLLLPANGPLQDVPMTRIRESLNTAPLRMVQRILVDDLPYTELLTADWVILDEIGARAWSHVGGYDPSGPRWQQVRYTDDRPMAGLLSYDMIWLRWRSAGANHNRGRANALSKALLCEDYLARDVRISSNLDLTDDDALADALRTDPACQACHQTLDPLASFLPYNPYRVIQELEWPETMYHPAWQNDWLDTSGVPPAYFGEDLRDLSALGQAIADDPRFARCTARRAAAYFTGRDLAQVPDAELDGLQSAFVASDFDYKALVKQVVLSASFATSTATDGSAVDGYRRIRPQELASVIEDLTGYRWQTELDVPCCGAETGSSRTGRVDLMEDDYHGYNQLAGGFDAFYVERHADTFNATTVLVTEELARRAADFVVDRDFDRAPENRRLLMHVERGTTDRVDVQRQIAFLHARLYGELDWTTDHAHTEDLFERVSAESSAERAWRVVLMAMLSDIRLLAF